ncbi:Erg28 like protein-domain-containing protein [Radiomyces spectabilis]|uniref:Erg28 like protein-domain-containing protein n=1 Tax=Radiomyces spectabilis TaxID=64574 RepID=UPI00221F728C|nr:Erg28 like protein-domain-containing protein [Radiomyces spectabilis]KAI8384679.1 Erg28 like protein-domain-containing protein [Radiomyces spectabilis]
MASIVSETVTNILSELPDGILPRWMLFTSALGIFNTIQNYCTSSLTKQVYGNKPEQISALSGRLFATWTWSVSMIRIYAAFHLQHRFMYNLGIWTYVIALTHFTSEWLVFRTCRVNKGFMSPMIVAVCSLIYLVRVKEDYVKFD